MNATHLDELSTFLAVAEHGTLRGAAAQLGVPTSTVSRRVERLEQHLDQELLRRTARSVALSDAGRALAERAAPALREAAEAMSSLGDRAAHPAGELRLSAPPDLGASPVFAELVAGFTRRHTGVRSSISLATRRVDLFEEGFDLALRIHSGQLPPSDHLVARRLGELRGGLFASPTYLEQRGCPAGLDELHHHCLVGHAGRTFQDGWPLQGPDGPVQLRVQPRVVLDDFAPIGQLLASGGGIGLLPPFVAAPYTDGGRLRRILPTWSMGTSTLSLVWLRSRHLAPRVRAFVDHVLEATKDASWLAG